MVSTRPIISKPPSPFINLSVTSSPSSSSSSSSYYYYYYYLYEFLTNFSRQRGLSLESE